MTGASTTANENSSSSNTNNSKKQQKQQQQQQQPQKQKQRKEHPLGRRNRQRNNNQRTALANIDDVESVQLEQAVRELNCFEALSVNNANNHRTFALEYLEGILARWCRHVEEQAIARTQKENAATKQQQQQSSPNIPPSFAAVAAGAGKSPSSQAAAAAAPHNSTTQVLCAGGGTQAQRVAAHSSFGARCDVGRPKEELSSSSTSGNITRRVVQWRR